MAIEEINITRMTRSFINPGGWSFQYDVYIPEEGKEGEEGLVVGNEGIVEVGDGWIPHGGLVLRNMKHDNYSFAQQFGAIGIIAKPIDTETYGKFKLLTLGPPDFVQVDQDGNTFDVEQSYRYFSDNPDSAPGNFASFNSEEEITVHWRSNFPLFDNGLEGDDFVASSHLYVTQRYIFTEYSDEPKHEPSGGLMASRVFPIIEFRYEDDGILDTVRVDYRMHLELDDEDDSSRGFNQAGVFQDFDIVPAEELAARAVLERELPDPSEGTFSAVEKPLLYEFHSDALNGGKQYQRSDQGTIDTSKRTWDNIHWWGYRGKGKEIISAPGAYHAAHLHWRWGLTLQLATVFTGDTQFVSQGAVGGPLVDPKIKDQTIKLAVTKYNAGQDPDEVFDLRTLMRIGFELLFTSTQSKPQEIGDGANIVLWYSIEVKPERSLGSDIGGTLFVHGIFFAHEAEPSGTFSLAAQLSGTREEQYISPKDPAQEWERFPENGG